MTNILFVCKFNRFRSVFAEAYFNKRNTDKSVAARSAGVIRGNPIDAGILALARARGLTLKKEPEGISMEALKWQTMIVIVADDVPESIFSRIRSDRIVTWGIRDANESVDAIFERVDDLIEHLGSVEKSG